MKRLIISFTILFLAVWVGLYAHQDPGYVLIGWGFHTLEMSLTLFMVLLLIFLVTAYGAVWMVRNFLGIRNRLRFWRSTRRGKRAQQISNQGLIELAQGNWAQAERA